MKKIIFPAIVFFAFFQFGCLKSPDFEQLSSNFVVASATDSSANFSSFQTYYISDTIAYVNSSSTDTILHDANSQKLVDAVKQNMNARGYTFVSKGSKPQLGLTLGVVKNSYVGVVYSGWWDSYAGWWDPWYWGWYYPYYYPWAYTYTITTGSVITSMVDLKNAQATQSLRIIWSSVMGGAIGDNLATNVQRGVEAINQSFIQSPLIKKN